MGPSWFFGGRPLFLFWAGASSSIGCPRGDSAGMNLSSYPALINSAVESFRGGSGR